jgi:hypothetical protein
VSVSTDKLQSFAGYSMLVGLVLFVVSAFFGKVTFIPAVFFIVLAFIIIDLKERRMKRVYIPPSNSTKKITRKIK